MKKMPDLESATRIAFATSEHQAAQDVRGNYPTRWSELSVYYDPSPKVRGKPWISISRGLSTYPGETTKQEFLQVGTLDRALKLFSDHSQLGRTVIAQAQEWAADNPPPGTMAFPILKTTSYPVGDNRFKGDTQEDLLDWLYGEERDKMTPAGLLARDFGAGESTVRAAIAAGRPIKVPLLAIARFIDGIAFRRYLRERADG